MTMTLPMKSLGYLSVGAVAGFAVGALAMNLGSTSRAEAATPVNTADKAAIEAVVRDYIATHGDELMNSIQASINAKQMDKIKNIITKDTPTRGPADAPITIIEFSDFQCPFCARVQPSLSELSTKYGKNIRWVFKNLPLSFHDEAKPAAYAALAAQNQGKYWEYADKLWANQASLGDKTYVKIAEELKLDMAKFNKDRADSKLQAIVEKDLEDAQAAGAQGTPHFIINGESMSGALPASEFIKVIDAKLDAAKK
ncbi:MAG: hypothetical protein DI585_00250 [Pseudomonas fluorescens]|nr:MAG: hypothetical protein DI585_00250 [Pseudomonas fluorescens]